MAMMVDILVAVDTVVVTTAKGQGVLRSCHSSCSVFVTDSGADQISTMIQPYNAMAPPPVKPSTSRMSHQTLLWRKQRTKHRLLGDTAEDTGDKGFFFGDSNDGPSDDNNGGEGFSDSRGTDKKKPFDIGLWILIMFVFLVFSILFESWQWQKRLRPA